MDKIVTTNFDCEYKQDKDNKFAIINMLGTTKQQQLIHINIPFNKIHTEDPIIYNGSTIIVRDGNGVLSTGGNSMYIKPNDIIMIDENKGFRLWSSHNELNVYIIYSTQVYPDNRKYDRNKHNRKHSLNIVSDDTHANDFAHTSCGFFRNCSK